MLLISISCRTSRSSVLWNAAFVRVKRSVYAFSIEGDNVVVTPKKEQVIAPLPSSSSLRVDEETTFAAARRFAPGWDVRALLDEWREWVQKKGIAVQNPDANFLSFCKTRGPYKR